MTKLKVLGASYNCGIGPGGITGLKIDDLRTQHNKNFKKLNEHHYKLY